jgi:hypothetical protein
MNSELLGLWLWSLAQISHDVEDLGDFGCESRAARNQVMVRRQRYEAR